MDAPTFFTDPTALIGRDQTSDWLTIDEEHLRAFAFSTFLDEEHVDLTTSRNHALGPELVDGFLLLSLLVHFDFANPMADMPGGYGFNYGFDRVRFTAPMFVDEAVRLKRTVVEVDLKTPTRALITYDTVMEVRREAPETVMVARWLVMAVDGATEERGQA